MKNAFLSLLGLTLLVMASVLPAAQPPTIGFSAVEYSARERDGEVVITVLRTGSRDERASVRYWVTDGSATEGEDYQADSGELNFGRGEQKETIRVRISRDKLVEGPETIRLQLGRPEKASLGTNSFATLTILDDDQAPDLSCAGHLDDSFVPDPSLTVPLFVKRKVFIEGQGDKRFIVAGVEATNEANIVRIKRSGALDTEFNTSSLAYISDLAVQSDGSFYVSTASPNGQPAVRRHLEDGELDPSFAPEVDGPVYSLAAKKSGDVYIAGAFSHVNGVALSGLARLNDNGTLDAVFKPVLAPPSNNVPTQVKLVVTEEDGNVLIVETGYRGLGLLTDQLVRLRRDGSRDTNFNPQIANLITAVAVQENGRILAAGLNFPEFSGVQLVRLNQDGSLDTSFAIPEISGSGDQGIDVILPLEDGRILIGGGFRSVNGQSRSAVARLNANGTLDPTFNTLITQNIGADDIQSVTSIVLQENGKFLIAGDFADVDGVKRSGLASVFAESDDCNGFVSFQVDTVNVLEETGQAVLVLERTGNNDAPIQVYYAILPADYYPGSAPLTPDGVVKFSSGQRRKQIVLPIPNDDLVEATETFQVVLISSTGGAILAEPRVATVRVLDDDSAGLPGQLVWNFNAPQNAFGPVQALAVQNGKLLIGASNGIFRLNLDGSLDNTFYPPAGLLSIHALALQNDGRILLDASFNSPNDNSVVLRLSPNGDLDASFIPVQHDRIVRAITVQPDGKILLGGQFTAVNGIERHGIARILENGQVDTSFAPFGIRVIDFRDGVYAVGFQSDGQIIIGGWFGEVNGFTHPYAARLSPSGAVDNSYNPLLGGPVGALLVQADDKVIYGGQFFQVANLPANSIFRFNTDGSLDTSFLAYIQLGNSYEAAVRTIQQQSDGKLLVGGVFEYAGSYNDNTGPVNRRGIARFDADGGFDDSFIPGTGAETGINAISVLPDGSIAIGGTFNFFNGYPRAGLALLYGDNNARPGFLEFETLFGGDRENAGPLRATVRRLWGTLGQVSVRYTTADLTARAGTDYVSQSGEIVFSDGDSTPKTIEIPLNDNSQVDSTFRQFSIVLSNPTSGARLGANSTNILTIVENELGAAFDFPTRRIADDEPFVTIDVYQIGTESFTVNYSTVDGTARANTDYEAQTGVLTFNGTGSRRITIPLLQNPGATGDRTFSITLTNPSLPNHAGTPTTITITRSLP